jgi:hypothetical protein
VTAKNSYLPSSIAQSHGTDVPGHHSGSFTGFNDYLTASLAIRARLAGIA